MIRFMDATDQQLVEAQKAHKGVGYLIGLNVGGALAAALFIASPLKAGVPDSRFEIAALILFILGFAATGVSHFFNVRAKIALLTCAEGDSPSEIRQRSRFADGKAAVVYAVAIGCLCLGLGLAIGLVGFFVP